MGKKAKAKTNSPSTGAAVKSKADDKKSGVKKIKENKQRRKNNKPKTGNGESGDSELRAAIRELGGDEEEDVALINGVEDGDADQEEEKEFTVEAQKELEAFIKSMGLDKKFRSSQVVEDASGGEDDKGEEEDDTEAAHENAASGNTEDREPLSWDDSGDWSKENAGKSKTNFLKDVVKSQPNRKGCLVKTSRSEKWHTLIPEGDPEDDDQGEGEKTPDYWVTKLEKYAEQLLSLETENHKRKGNHRKPHSDDETDPAYLETVLRSGALGDKISAHAVLLQTSPVQNLASLEALVGFVSLKSRRPCMMALDALRECFVATGGGLLPTDRRLSHFRDQPFHRLQELSAGSRDARDKCLTLWMFEHKLKGWYAKFLQQLDDVAKDQMTETKIKAMRIFLDLLMSNPEQEQGLLERLVNKLGDPVRSIASKAMYQLKVLLEEHSAMKGVVMAEVERLLYRPNVSAKTQYYGICFLSQMLLGNAESALADRLIKIYLGFFKACVKKGEIDSKLMSALLTGVNRAFPYCDKVDTASLEGDLKVMFRVVHLSGFNVAVQALMLIHQIMDRGEAATDRFYSALYRKVIDPELATSTKQALFLNLLYKSMKKDSSVKRTTAFVKRLLQVCQFLPPQLTCGCLFLVSEVARARPEVRATLTSAATTAAGTSSVRVFSDGVESEDDGEEHYSDVKEEGEDGSDAADEEEAEESDAGAKARPSWVHVKNRASRVPRKKSVSGLSYDPYQRNPLCGAESCPLFELNVLARHFHPSVAMFAESILTGQNIKYDGDPLQDFTLMRFLDRFVFRNPKKDPTKGKPQTVLGRRNKGSYVPTGIRAVAPGSKEYLNREEVSVPKDEVFIYKYFKEKRAKETDEQDSDADSVTSEDFNAFMDRIGGKEDGGAADLDLDFSAANADDLKGLDSGSEDDVDDSDVDEGDDDDSDEEPELEGEDDDGSDSVEFDDIGEMGSDDDDEEDEFGEEQFALSDEDDEQPLPGPSKRKRKVDTFPGSKKKFKKSSGGDLQSLLASAEEFSDLMDQNDGGREFEGSSEAVSTVKDKASRKQLKWERDKADKKKNWSKGKKTFTGGGKKRFKKR